MAENCVRIYGIEKADIVFLTFKVCAICYFGWCKDTKWHQRMVREAAEAFVCLSILEITLISSLHPSLSLVIKQSELACSLSSCVFGQSVTFNFSSPKSLVGLEESSSLTETSSDRFSSKFDSCNLAEPMKSSWRPQS